MICESLLVIYLKVFVGEPQEFAQLNCIIIFIRQMFCFGNIYVDV